MSTPALINPGPSARGWHRLQLFLECPQRYAWTYVAKADRGEPGPPLVIGTLIHVGIAHYYARLRAAQRREDKDAFYDPTTAVQVLAEVNGGGIWGDHVEAATAAVAEYIAHWSPREAPKVLHVEEVFEVRYPVRGPPIRGETSLLMTARVDLVVEMSGKVLLVDHKSTGRLDSKQAKFYGVSGQLLNYKWIGSMVYGEKFGGVMLNMVQHTPPKFERPRLDPAPALFARFPQIVEDAERRIAELEDEGRAPGEWPACPTELTCFHRYGPCDHLERCKWGA